MLKILKNWFEEVCNLNVFEYLKKNYFAYLIKNFKFLQVKLHLTISNKWVELVRRYGLTQDLTNGNYMLVMNKMTIDLRIYLQQNHSQLTWKERIEIAFAIINSFCLINKENAIHRDLLFNEYLRKSALHTST